MRTQRRISVFVDCATLYEGSAARNVVADEGTLHYRLNRAQESPSNQGCFQQMVVSATTHF